MNILKKPLFSAAILSLSGAMAIAQPAIYVAKTSGCGCCLAWMEHLEENDFAVTSENLFGGTLVRMKLDNGIPVKMFSCHTAVVEGYTIEGHVPAADIERLLAEAPDAVGLAVPGMPIGSPGMDFSDNRDAYDVFLVKKDGSTEVFSSYLAS